MMEQNNHYKLAAMIGGALAGAGQNIYNLLQAPLKYSYQINWAETFQVCWKAFVGALVGLTVKFLWDKILKKQKESN